MDFSDEMSLLSSFECEPELLDNILISSLDFDRISSLIILSDNRNGSSILIKTECTSIEIHFKPRFKIILKYIGNH